MLSDTESVQWDRLRRVPKDQLTERGAQVLADLDAKAIPDTSFGDRVDISFGRGLLDLGQGVKQLGMQAGESLGLLGPGSTQQYTDQVNTDMAEYDRLSNAYPASTGVSRFGGNVAAMPVGGPGASSGVRAATTGLLGGAVGGAEFSPDMSFADRGRRSLWGAGGGVGGEALGAAAGRYFGRGGATDVVPVPPDMVENLSSSAGREAGLSGHAALPAPPPTAAGVTPEYEIPLTAGQHSGDLDQQIYEQRVLHGNLGPQAADDLTGFEGNQRAAMEAASADAHRRVSRRDRRRSAEEGRAAKEGLTERAGEHWEQINDAYTRAREAGAELTPDDTAAIFESMRGRLDRYDMSTATVNPNTHEFLERLEDFFPQVEEGAEIVGIDAFALDGLRRELGGYMGVAKGSDKRNLKILQRELDDQLLAAADEGRLIGDADGIYALREGIQMRADYGRLYGPHRSGSRSGRNRSDPAGKIIEDIIEIDMPGEEVVRNIFGTSKLGGSAVTRKVFERVESIAGRDSDEYRMLQSAAMEQFRKSVTNPQGGVSAQKFSKTWRELQSNSPDLVAQVFGGSAAHMDTLAAELAQTMYNPRAMNPSKTAFMMANIMRQGSAPAMGAAIGGATAGPVGAVAGAGGGMIYDATNNTIKDMLGRLFAKRIYKPLTRGSQIPGVVGRGAGLTGEREFEDYQNE